MSSHNNPPSSELFSGEWRKGIRGPAKTLQELRLVLSAGHIRDDDVNVLDGKTQQEVVQTIIDSSFQFFNLKKLRIWFVDVENQLIILDCDPQRKQKIQVYPADSSKRRPTDWITPKVFDRVNADKDPQLQLTSKQRGTELRLKFARAFYNFLRDQ